MLSGICVFRSFEVIMIQELWIKAYVGQCFLLLSFSLKILSPSHCSWSLDFRCCGWKICKCYGDSLHGLLSLPALGQQREEGEEPCCTLITDTLTPCWGEYMCRQTHWRVMPFFFWSTEFCVTNNKSNEDLTLQ